jgi:hypothetical protein
MYSEQITGASADDDRVRRLLRDFLSGLEPQRLMQVRVAVRSVSRRTKIIPHAFGERPVLKLMYAAFIRAADRWCGITVGEFEQRQLRAIREELDRAHAERIRPVVRPKASASPMGTPSES